MNVRQGAQVKGEHAGIGAGKRLDVHTCEQFLLLEARLLDEARFDEWLALFTPEASYWVPSEPGQADPLETAVCHPASENASAPQLDSGAATNIHCPQPLPSGF